MLEAMVMATPAGYLYIRPDDHSGFKPTVVGFSKNVPEYPFPIWDPDRIIVQDVRNVSAPLDWPKPGDGHDDPSATYNWDQDDLADTIDLSVAGLESATP